MKILSALIVSLVSCVATAATVRVDSFYYLQNGSRLAELYGTVEGSPSSAIRIVVDPRTNRPGVYNTFAGNDGKFCLTLVSLSGEAQVSASEHTVSSTVSKTR